MCFVGGDRRMSVAADMFGSDGYDVVGYAMPYCKKCGEEQMLLCDALILPTPCTFDGKTVYSPLSSETVYLGEIKEIAASKPVYCGKVPQEYSGFIDYYDDALQVSNAAPTAEAAIAIAIEHSDRTLMQSRALIIGGGRVAKALAQRLAALGCKTTVAARKAADRAYFKSIYCDTCDIAGMSKVIGGADIIFNTVPARILNAECLEAIRRGTPLIELASSPYCIDQSQAGACGIEFIKAPGLPGKYFCITAGEAIYERIKEYILNEEQKSK